MAKSIIGRRVFYASSSICDNNSEMEHVASISKERQLRLSTEYALTQYVLRRVIHKLHSFISTLICLIFRLVYILCGLQFSMLVYYKSDLLSKQFE